MDSECPRSNLDFVLKLQPKVTLSLIFFKPNIVLGYEILRRLESSVL